MSQMDGQWTMPSAISKLMLMHIGTLSPQESHHRAQDMPYLVGLGLAYRHETHDWCHITERGRFFVNHLCSTPLPEQQWIIPAELQSRQ